MLAEMSPEAFKARSWQRRFHLAVVAITFAALVALEGCSGGNGTAHPASSLGDCDTSHDCVRLSLTGALNGDMLTTSPLSSFMRCTVPSGNSTVWLGDLFGEVAGHPWEMVVEVLRYDGPRSYSAAFSLSPAPAGNAQTYSGNGTLTLQGGARSGTVRAVLSDPTNHSRTVLVSGAFSCPST